MKKYVGTLLAGVTLMAALPMAAQAADNSKETTAKIELSQDEENKDITLDQVPGVDLGSHVNQNATKTYTADAVDGAIKVTNPGNTDGWKVQVAGTDFKDGDKVLRGAKLTFANGKTTADDTENASDLPTSDTITVNTNNQSIVTAAVNEGIGEFTTTHDKADVSLLVPAGNSAGAYKSTLTWTLSNAPS
ncbi:WxL domain-containing protein [Lactiplantibacillus garii]|uniref:WxL domain-containing protein n=1 Tax=Lactiplantibacillus garii TaxID=2306423 RepID=A0A3R8LJM1_9LACO|nr:WxL domain-containing protein [Lactiplantibacillus garii]RRK10255.1 WxL domain-containing protein [Lactiplantibacillus garii]